MAGIASLFETLSPKGGGGGAGDVECGPGTDRSFSTGRGPEFHIQCHKHKKEEGRQLMENKMSTHPVWLSLCP